MSGPTRGRYRRRMAGASLVFVIGFVSALAVVLSGGGLLPYAACATIAIIGFVGLIGEYGDERQRREDRF